MEVVLAQQDDLKNWDGYLDAHPDGCAFQTSTWQQAVVSAYGHRVFYLMARRDHKICGVLPLIFMNNRFFPRVLATSPYASFGAICADGEEEARGLIEKAIELSYELRASYLELKSVRENRHERLIRHTDYVTYRLALNHPDQMWSNTLAGRARTGLRKAESFQLTCSRGHHLLDVFYDIMADNMRRLGTPIHSKAFYQNILLGFGSKAEIFVALYQGLPIAALLTLRHQSEITVLYASSLSQYWNMYPNKFLYWEAMKQAFADGARFFDFGRSLQGSGTSKFKEELGALPRQLYYEYFLNGLKSIPRINQSNPRYRWATSIWKRIPLGLTKLLGPLLIKNIP